MPKVEHTDTWTKTPIAILKKIRGKEQVEWDTDWNQHVLAKFIEKHCDQSAFERFVALANNGSL